MATSQPTHQSRDHSCSVIIGEFEPGLTSAPNVPIVVDYRITCVTCGLIEKAGEMEKADQRATRHEYENDSRRGYRCPPGDELYYEQYRVA